jgi:hypothetical protein
MEPRSASRPHTIRYVNRTRRPPWWAWVLGTVAVFSALVVWEAAITTSVNVANNTASAVRIAFCNDNPVDLSPGSAGTVDVVGTTASCTVFNMDRDYAYEGCLHLSRSAARATVHLDNTKIQAGVSQPNCEKAG